MKNIARYLLLFVFSVGVSFTQSEVTAQPINLTVKGKVTSSSDNNTLPGVNIEVKGTSKGTITDLDGNYSLNFDDNNAILVFSFIGFASREIAVDGQSVIDVELAESAVELGEVVVTALGISREEKSLGYSVEKIDGSELTKVVHENVLNSLAGKVSGVTINSTGGTGSTVSMLIRGATSLSTDNQPLFVVDGVPIGNTVNNVGGFGDDNRVDYGNEISDLNPENIESITILKGPSAAALYGTRAGNGVVLITTKKAKKGDRMKITYTTNTVFDIPTRFLDVQDQFASGFFSFRPENVGGGRLLPPISAGDGTGAGPENDQGFFAVQWDSPLDENGARIPTEVVSYPNNIKNFLNDYAYTTTNGISISNTSDALAYRLSFTNLNHSGLIPNSDLNKNNLSLSVSSKLLDKLTISTNINFGNTYANNRPSSNRGSNPLQWAYGHPANIDIRQLQNYGTGSDISRVSGNHENPYFLANEVNNSFERYRIFGNIVADWNISPSFSLMARHTLNKSDEIQESKIAPGYLREPNNGSYGIVSGNGFERNTDILGTYKKDLSDFTFSTSVGGNILYRKASSLSTSSKSGSGLVVPNLFTVQNISSGALQFNNYRSEKAIYSVYGLANLGWKNTVYLDLTARNDWSSTLPSENRSYFYPSASLSVLTDKIINLGKNIDMLKLRIGWAKVGNDTDPYRLDATYGDAGQWGGATRLTKSGGLLSPNLLPEESTSIEFGTDIKMFSNRLRFEGTYYTVENKNQILGVPLAASSGFGSVQINAGLLESTGWEVLLGATPIRTANWNWDLNFSFTKNETKIIELAEGVDFIQFWNQARVRSIGYAQNIGQGQDGLIGNLYAREVKRVTDTNSQYFGYPILGSGLDAEWEGEEELSKIGNYNPDFILGLQTSLSYKNLTLSMVFDWRSGGQYVSQTYRYLSESVLTQTWLDELINPGDLGGSPSQALRDWVIENAEELLLADRLRPVGGPTPAYGGFPESFSGVTVYDGTFAPGVVGYHDENGDFVLIAENLGNEGTIFLPYVVSYPWDIGRANMFDADYIKLREISLNYSLPNRVAQKIGMENINLSFYTRSIMLWTKDANLGVDPERAFQAERGGRFSQGVERYNVNPWVSPVGFKIGSTF